MSKIKVIFWLDILLLILFTLVLLPEATGINTHQYIGITLSLGVLTHLLLHRKWISNAIKRRPRLFWLDILLGFAFTWTVLSGLLISPLLGHNDEFGHMAPVHHAGVALFVLIFLIHLLAHRKWLWQAVKRYAFGVYAWSPQK